MSARIRYKLLRELRFENPDGSLIQMEIPQNLSQRLLRQIVRDDYLVMTVTTGRTIAESEVCTLKCGNNIVGFLIPGQAILSPDQPRNSDDMFAAYSLIAAMEICERSFRRDYALSTPQVANSGTPRAIFQDGVFYLVAWTKKIGVNANEFADKYFVSLAQHGIISAIGRSHPLKTQRTLSSYNDEIRLTSNAAWPEYIRTIMFELQPFAADPFLRFFYLYQVIEALMSQNYKDALARIRLDFDAAQDLSITQLRDYVEKFQKVYKEKTRINQVLTPQCARSKASAEAILSALGEKEEGEPTFAELVYKIRNIIFHDYRRVHAYADLVACLEDDLAGYLLEKKLM